MFIKVYKQGRHGGAVPVPSMGPAMDTGTFTLTITLRHTSASQERLASSRAMDHASC